MASRKSSSILEEEAILKLKLLLNKTRRTRSFLESNDKTPFLDGAIQLYSDSSLQKKSLEGVLNVQVKARQSKSSSFRKFSHRLNDLEGYSKLGGVMFFIAHFVDEASPGVFYYTIMTKELIARYLSKVNPGGNSISIPCKPLPEDVDQLIELLRLARSKLSPKVKVTPQRMSEIRQLALYFLDSTGVDSGKEIDLVEENVDLVGIMSDGQEARLNGSIQYLGTGLVDGEWELRVGEARYGVEGHTDWERRESVAKFNESLSISFPLRSSGEKRMATIRLVTEASPADYVEAVELLQRAREVGEIVIVNVGCVAAPDLSSLSLANLSKVAKLLDYLNVDARAVLCSELSPDLLNMLVALHDHLVDGKESVPVPSESTFMQFELPRGVVILCAVERGEVWRLVNPFDADAGLVYACAAADGDPAWMCTIYDWLEVDVLAKCLNADFANIASHYRDVSVESKSYDNAVNTVVKLLQIYEVAEVGRGKYLEAATALAERLKEVDPNSLENTINVYQCILRERSLTRQELRRLAALKGEVDSSNVLHLLAISTLQGVSSDAEYYYDKLSGGDRAQFESWPIYSIYKRLVVSVVD